MSEEKEAKGVPMLYPTEKVEYCWWNMNVMDPEEFHALKEDMRAKGPYGINPILVARPFPTGMEVPEGVLICVDGNQRLKAAKELKWPQIRVDIDESIKLEEDARTVSYHKNYERGHIDAWKEAQNFQWLKEKGWTQERIAKEYHIDKSQVSKRLSLLEVLPAVKKELQELPRVKVTASHFEPIATLKPKLQIQAAKEIKEQAKRDWVREEGTISARTVEKIARDVKEEDEKKTELEAQVKKYQHKKCPKCRKQPVRKDGRGFPWVQCEQYHSWNLKTGMTAEEEMREKYPKVTEAMERAKPQKAPFPNYLRTTYTLAQFKEMFSNYSVDVLGSLKSVKDVNVQGIDRLGNKVSLSYDITMIGVHLGYNDKISFNVEEKTYESEKLKDFKTVVTTWPEINNKAKAKETSELVSSMMDQYGEKPKRKRGPKPGRKKGKRRKRSKGKRGK